MKRETVESNIFLKNVDERFLQLLKKDQYCAQVVMGQDDDNKNEKL